MFTVGDKIVYPMHGVGTIDAIEKKVVLGKRNEFYIITILSNISGLNTKIIQYGSLCANDQGYSLRGEAPL